MKFIHHEGRIQSHKANKKENKIVRSYMNVNCWTNQTILSVIVTEYTDLYIISM